jgi:hypothetical protein
MSVHQQFRDEFVAALMAADEAKCAEFYEMFNSMVERKPKSTGGAAAAKRVTKKESVVVAMPDGGSIPTPADYRVTEVDHSVCVARTMKIGVDDDKRWSPAVYREHQCGKAVESGSDICSKCAAAAAKAAASGKHGSWNGRVTEEPPKWCHMLGTAWAAKCKWVGGASGSDEDSESGGSMSSSNAAPKKQPAPKKESKPKAKPVADIVPVTTFVAPAVADTSAPVVEVSGSVEIIGHTMYWVRNGNAYEYEPDTATAGVFIGRVNPDGTIDADADELVESESDSE